MAYEWGQQRIATWLEEIANTSGDPEDPKVVRFNATWEACFFETMSSNQVIIDIRNDAIRDGSQVATFRAIRLINSVFTVSIVDSDPESGSRKRRPICPLF
jgi:hypothetical protein